MDSTVRRHSSSPPKLYFNFEKDEDDDDDIDWDEEEKNIPPILKSTQSLKTTKTIRKSITRLAKLKNKGKFTEDDVRDVFRYFDRDGDGYISIAEIQSAFSEDFTSDEFVEMFENAKTPTQEARSPTLRPESPSLLDLPSPMIKPSTRVTSFLDSASPHEDIQLSFDEFYNMVVRTPSGKSKSK